MGGQLKVSGSGRQLRCPGWERLNEPCREAVLDWGRWPRLTECWGAGLPSNRYVSTSSFARRSVSQLQGAPSAGDSGVQIKLASPRAAPWAARERHARRLPRPLRVSAAKCSPSAPTLWRSWCGTKQRGRAGGAVESPSRHEAPPPRTGRAARCSAGTGHATRAHVRPRSPPPPQRRSAPPPAAARQTSPV